MIDFLKYRYICYAVSATFLFMGAFAYFAKGFNYNVDFTGGSELRISFTKPVEIGSLRKTLSDKGWKDAVIQSVGSDNKAFLIQVGGAKGNVGEKIFDAVKDNYKGYNANLDGIDWVGPEAGKDIQWNALISIILSLLLILFYVTIRSKYKYAAGAVIAIAHDMLAVLAFFLIFGEQISVHVLAAILTVLGYSLNDTIVIFSRVRENLKKMKGEAEAKIVNVSINQTLRRTMLTSFSTILAVGSILVLGGDALHGFSLAMLIGIIVGTYSSVYIASPIMLAFSSYSRDDS